MSAMQDQVVLYVNVDVIFAVNFVTDMALLWATGNLSGVPFRWQRLALASAVGSVAAIAAYFPQGSWILTLPGVVLGTAGLLALAYWPCRTRQALRLVAYFVLSGGILAGVALLAGSKHGHPIGMPAHDPGYVPSSMVAAGLLICLVGVRYLWQAARERLGFARGLYRLRIKVHDRMVEATGLVDTGNALKDPLTGTPVAVVEAAVLASILPALVLDAVSWGWDALEQLPPSWATRCRMVPFRAVGKPVGVMLALAPDEFSVQAPGNSRWCQVRGLVGIAVEPLHPEGTYRALLSPALVESLADVPGIA